MTARTILMILLALSVLACDADPATNSRADTTTPGDADASRPDDARLADAPMADTNTPADAPDTNTPTPDADADAQASDADAQASDADAQASDADAQASDADAQASDADMTIPPLVGDWQLPDGHFTPARMPMALVHPRDTDAPAWAYAKNAYPGLAWETPVVVQGGAWPFQYRIVDDGGAAGLSIGGELRRTEVGDVILHEMTPDYGVLSWDDPQTGTFSIQLQVTDQEGSVVDVPLTLTVGVDDWLFVDADNGDDATADGSINAPFRTLSALHGDVDDARWANHRVYLGGVVALDGNRPNGNFRMDPNVAPSVWVGWPGRDAVLEAHEGKLIVSTPDFYMANLEHRHRADFIQNDGAFLHMITVWDAPRFTIHDVTFSRFQGVPVNEGLGNSSVMMFTRGADRPHVAIVNNTITGPSGVFTSTYSLRRSVFEKNTWTNADLSLSDGSVPSVIFIKSDNEDITLRANRMIGGNTWSGLSGIGVNEARDIEVAHNTVETPYTSGRSGGLRMFTNAAAGTYSWTVNTPIWIDRNTFVERISWEGEALANMPDGVVLIERNVSPTSIPTSTRIIATDNLADGAFLDAALLLTGAARTDHLGRRGAELAAPLVP